MYVQSNTLLLADVFEKFRDKCIEIYKLDPAHFLSAPGLSREACLKMTGIKLELLTNENMLKTIEKGIRGGMCNAIYRYTKANNKYMKNHIKNIESLFLAYLDANNLYGWAMSKRLPVDGFKWIKKSDLSKFDENFIKNYDENSDIRYILQVHEEYLKILQKLHSDLPFLPQRMKTGNCNKLVNTSLDKKKNVIHVRALKQALNNGLILKKST